jgi:hypothetical protein
VTWEYLMVVVNDVHQLNTLGSEGWEVLAAVPQAINTVWCLLKRPIPDGTSKTRKRA